jgi:putative membrane protein
VLVFNLTIATIIGERQIAVTGLFIVLLPLVLVVVLGMQRVNRYRGEELDRHQRDFT